MRVLLACEESQAVTKEFRKLGHDAYSCDILPPSGGARRMAQAGRLDDGVKGTMGHDNSFPPLYISNGYWEQVV